MLRSPVRVKICGITNRDDALAAIAAGADALGFNFFPGSRRYIAPEENLGWIGGLPPFVTRVAVVVDAPLGEAHRLATHPAIDAVQLHGDEDLGYCAELARLGSPFIKALRLSGRAIFADAEAFSTRHVLLDAFVPGEFGGTGTVADLGLAAEFVREKRGLNVILAGGLTPENVASAVALVRPFAVDVAGGVELEPRRKDIAKIQAFCIAAAR